MKQFIYLSVFSILFFASCTPPFKKGDAGIEYKIIEDGSGKKLTFGNYMQLHITQSYKDAKKDTILSDTQDYMPRIEIFDSASTPPAYLKILKNARKGDSLVFRLLTDSIYKMSPTEMPPFMAKGNYLYTRVKILNIFESREQADSANKAEMKSARPKIHKKQMEQVQKELDKNKVQIDADSKLISAYLEKNNIKAVKGDWGTYIDIHTEGTGDQIDNNSVAVVKYTGKSLDSGVVFDSNVDPKFNHTEPLEITISQVGTVVLGWTDALVKMKKGTKATVYIPSSLGYGKNGNMPKIKPDVNLVFDMEIIDVISEDVAIAQAAEKQKASEEARQRMMDSLKRTLPTNK